MIEPNFERAEAGTCCISECLAILLDRLDPPKMQNGWWRGQIANWCLSLGYVAEDAEPEEVEPGEYCIAVGDSPRGTLGGHAVIWKEGEGVVHDPHSSGLGLDGPPAYFMRLRPEEDVRAEVMG